MLDKFFNVQTYNNLAYLEVILLETNFPTIVFKQIHCLPSFYFCLLFVQSTNLNNYYFTILQLTT